MSGFQLDTSGEVGPMPGARYGSPGCVIDAAPSFIRWSDLSPFVQGYVEALLRTADTARGVPHDRHLAFSDLSPEALAMIFDRCVAYEREARDVGLWEGDRTQGEWFWKYQQKLGRDFPLNPLTPTLSEDGKVNLVVQAQVGGGE